MIGGTIKFWSHEKGFGFIAGDDGVDVFVHANLLERLGLATPMAGDRVWYVAEENPRRPGKFVARELKME